MTHPLYVRADMIRGGVLIALEADDLKRRLSALEATLRATDNLQQELRNEIDYLKGATS